MYKIGFLSNKLTLGGTEIAMYDYAHFNEIILGNKSIIISRRYEDVKDEINTNKKAYDKFSLRFHIEYYNTQEHIDNIVERNQLTHLYIIKYGIWDGIITTKCKNLIHCVFKSVHPHGEVYSVISDEVNRISGTNYSVVPHMIYNEIYHDDLREILNISKEALVFGRYGSLYTFDISFVHETIKKIVNERSDIYFIFMNTEIFYNHSNIIYLEGTTDMKIKRAFINTCDAMIHARFGGETFGLACGEFAILNKPIITFSQSEEKNHINILGNKAILYENERELYEIFSTFYKEKYDMKNNGYFYYTPENVMHIFKEVYLDEEQFTPYIYINAFWDGYKEKKDANNIEYFIELFWYIFSSHVEITEDLEKANILLESVFPNEKTHFLGNYKKWKLKIGFSGEPYLFHINYDIFLNSIVDANYQNNHKETLFIDLPLCVMYTYNTKNFQNLIYRPIKKEIPSKFCCFIVSNGNCKIRNHMFEMLSVYKKVDSLGSYMNNTNNGGIPHKYWSQEYLDILKQYKFIICFENSKQETYITEKIINPYLAQIVPIYWGTHHVKKIFNMNSMLFLENESKDSFIDLIYKIIELDNDDAKYLKMINEPVFSREGKKYWQDNYTYEMLSKKMKEKMREKIENI